MKLLDILKLLALCSFSSCKKITFQLVPDKLLPKGLHNEGQYGYHEVTHNAIYRGANGRPYLDDNFHHGSSSSGGFQGAEEFHPHSFQGFHSGPIYSPSHGSQSNYGSILHDNGGSGNAPILSGTILLNSNKAFSPGFSSGGGFGYGGLPHSPPVYGFPGSSSFGQSGSISVHSKGSFGDGSGFGSPHPGSHGFGGYPGSSHGYGVPSGITGAFAQSGVIHGKLYYRIHNGAAIQQPSFQAYHR